MLKTQHATPCSRRPAPVKRAVRETTENSLIDALQRADRAPLVAACKPVDLKLGEVLMDPGQRIRYTWFPVRGFISMLTTSERPSRARLETGLIGCEGVCGMPLALGPLESLQQALVQNSGTALRIGATALHRELQRNVALQRILNCYTYVLMAQLAQSALCVAFHQIEPRLAGWLLMSQDRAQSDTFEITPVFLAAMLGVRREGVTGAAGALQRQGLIRYSRGHLSVTNRRGLEHAACDCYRIERASWRRWLG